MARGHWNLIVQARPTRDYLTASSVSNSSVATPAGEGLAGGESSNQVQASNGDGATPANESEGENQVKTQENTLKESNPEENPINIKVFKADPNDATNTVELDKSDYTVKPSENVKDMYNYTFNDNVNCTIVEFDGKEVWKHDSNRKCGKYPKYLHINHKTQELVLYIDDCIITLKKDRNGNWQENIRKITRKGLISLQSDSSSPDFKLYTQDSKDPNSSIELNDNDYNVIKLADDAVYTFKDNVKCTLIKCGSKEVWRHDGGAYPKKVSNIVTQNKIVIQFAADNIKSYVKESNEWKEELTNSSQSKNVGSTPVQSGDNLELGSLYPDTYGSGVVIGGKSAQSGGQSNDSVLTSGGTNEARAHPDLSYSTTVYLM
ncbi:hypothetical protein MACJ_002644 [Theileria orientalis]|uniref:Uncharacterized protein n=1 Tax=Theileria orientalis TaxID=68886 RepID=A0A976M6G3_THEOR|nr:hypothetical protein MACJ_002644 [Theileria orientalis]